MSEPPSFSGRYILALVLAHLAASYSFTAATILSSDIAWLLAPLPSALFTPTLKEVGVGIMAFLPASIGISLLTALFLAPYSIAGALAAWPVATMGFGPLTTVLIGGLIGGVLFALRTALAVSSGGVLSPWTGVALRGEVSSIIAGAAYGWVIWRMLIKPEQHASIRSGVRVTQ